MSAEAFAQPSRFAAAGHSGPTSTRWKIRRLNRPNRLWGSNGVAFGPDGRLYVAQFLAGQISAVDVASGDVEVIVPADGVVQAPDDLAFGADGSMYITDLVPGRVWRRDPRGEFSLVSDQLRVPNGITCVGDRLFVNEMTIDGRLVELFPDGGEPRVLTDGLVMGNAMQLGPDGCLYYPHMLTDQVFRIPLEGGEPELVADEVHEPVAVRFDRGGVLFVLSRGAAGLVTGVDLAGTGSRTVVASGVTGLDNAAFDDENRMFVSSYASGGIAELHVDGRTRDVVPQGLDGPFGVAVGGDGTVYAADHYRLASPADAASPAEPASPVDSASAAVSAGHGGSGSAGGPGGPAVLDGSRSRAGEPGGVRTREMMIFVHGVAAAEGLLHVSSQYGRLCTYDPVARTVRVRADGLDRPAGLAVRGDGSLVVAETGTGRVLAVDEDDVVTVLADGLDHPVDVAFDDRQRCHVSDAGRGAVFRLDDGEAVLVADDLGAPQGLAIRGDELFVVETEHRRLRAISLSTGEHRIDAEDLPVGLPPGITRAEPALFCHGMPGLPRQFTGLAVDRDGALYLSANGEGSVLRLTPRPAASSEG
ncbi:SMP-30/gluconolactonase/LRE family protein [Actinoalloteichus fjordicus]|uniref:Gluconolactonase n=1 Tax=Actinoalloteichus fjordicus TaxID=1612552 RepID=A0AAC9PSV7_9PSEU|nr:SMP-30/gluconolactonase/LRE family protein [Actinoalloteichus fjordicus]APU15503.1 gluconolactonase [Actinoalloteichus fjordicus]